MARLSVKIRFICCLLLLGSALLSNLSAADWAAQRRMMVERDLKGRDIVDKEVLAAMEQTPRHLFVPEHVRAYAYGDRPLPIGEGQTISQPYIVALMSQLLEIKKGMKILEIGTGSGYQAGVLHALGACVYSIEIIPALALRTNKLFQTLALPIQIKNADGYFGWAEAAPFDRIIITAAANHIPRPLIDQLKPDGKLILPLGNTRFYQTLTLLTKNRDGKISTEYHSNVRFVPMTGKMIEK